MIVYDITVSLSADTPVFPGDPQVKIEPVTSLERGDAANVSGLFLSTHAGTHLDAPHHYDHQGLTVDLIPLSLLMGESLVVDLRGHRVIDTSVLTGLVLQGVERLLFRTDNSSLWSQHGFCETFSALTIDAAEYLVAVGVKLVGIDYLSIEPFDGDGTVHRTLLSGGVIILEGIDLSAVPAGRYELLCLPLKTSAGDGAPVRAVLRRRGQSQESTDFDPHSSRWPLA